MLPSWLLGGVENGCWVDDGLLVDGGGVANDGLHVVVGGVVDNGLPTWPDVAVDA